MKVIKLISTFFIHIAVWVTSGGAAWFIYNFLKPYAAAERGYDGAVGGEAILALCAGVAIFQILRYIANGVCGWIEAK